VLFRGKVSLRSYLDIKQIIWAILLVVIGIILSIIFHAIGSCKAFLPMHITVMLGGFILSWPYAIAVALITPLLNWIFTGSPPFSGLLYMIPELVTYTIVINALYRRNENALFMKRVYLPLLIAMILGRLTASLFQAVLFANSVGLIAFFASTIIIGFPGIILQLIIIPGVMYGLAKAKFIELNLDN